MPPVLSLVQVWGPAAVPHAQGSDLVSRLVALRSCCIFRPLTMRIASAFLSHYCNSLLSLGEGFSLDE